MLLTCTATSVAMGGSVIANTLIPCLSIIQTQKQGWFVQSISIQTLTYTNQPLYILQIKYANVPKEIIELLILSTQAKSLPQSLTGSGESTREQTRTTRTSILALIRMAIMIHAYSIYRCFRRMIK